MNVLARAFEDKRSVRGKGKLIEFFALEEVPRRSK